MKVVHISTLTKGGAAKSAFRLHEGLKNLKVDSKYVALINTEYAFDDRVEGILQNGTKKEYTLSLFLKHTIQRLINKVIRALKPGGFEPFSPHGSPYDVFDHPTVRDADIVHLHWVSGFIDYARLQEVSRKKTVVWTLHDMNPFTGGCHYSGGCQRYEVDCKKCPQLFSSRFFDLAAHSFNLKRSLKGSNITIVTPSIWLGECSKRSNLFAGFNHLVIPYGLNEKVFYPRSKSEIRKEMGLPEDKKILLFVCDELSNKRKGFSLLVEAINFLTVSDFLLCTVGKPSDLTLKAEVKNWGIVKDENLMAKIYSSADLFIIPSLEDNLPNTVLESLLVGTPVVGFDVGGIADMVNDANGFLARDISSLSLANAIDSALEKKFDRRLIAKLALEKYAQEVQATKYLLLYENLRNGIKQ